MTTVVLAQAGFEVLWDWDVAWDFLPEIARGLFLVTLPATLLGITIAVLLGLVLALLRRSQLKAVRYPTGLFIEFVRSTPLLVQLFFLFFVMPDYGLRLSAFTALVVGLAVHYGAYTSESYRAGIESVHRGQWEASTALNLSSTTKWRRVILPQAIPTVIPALGNYLVAMIKDAPLGVSIGVIGVLGAAFREASQNFRFVEAYTLVGALFLAVSIPLALFARYLEKRYGYERA